MNKDRACFFINIIKGKGPIFLTNEQWTRVRLYCSPLVFFLIIGGTEQQEHWETRVVFFTLYSNIINHPCSVLRHVAVIEVSSLSTTSTSYPCSSTGLSLCLLLVAIMKKELLIRFFSESVFLRSISICSLLLWYILLFFSSVFFNIFAEKF